VSPGPLKNVAASVHQRLLNKARATGRPFNELLQYFAMERFLYRLAASPHRDGFVLKDALMLAAWKAPLSRPTRDIDLLGRTRNDLEAIASVVRDVCRQTVEPDGLDFASDTVSAQRITEGAEYEGVRVRLLGHLGNARITLQLDIGFGDVVVPSPVEVAYPTLLDFPPPTLRGYTMESTIAEKLQAMVTLGELNSRMKDFYDIWLLSRHFDFDGATLARAIASTFAARGTDIPQSPVALTAPFAESDAKRAQWQAFLRRNRLDGVPADFPEVVAALAAFLAPVLVELAAGQSLTAHWPARGPWAKSH